LYLYIGMIFIPISHIQIPFNKRHFNYRKWKLKENKHFLDEIDPKDVLEIHSKHVLGEIDTKHVLGEIDTKHVLDEIDVSKMF